MKRAQPWLGTLVEITLVGAGSQADAARYFQAAFAAVAEIQGLMSFHDPASDVSRLNAAKPGDCVSVSPHTAAVLAAALDMQRVSQGLFDMGCASTLVAWGLLPKVGVPDAVIPSFTPGQMALAITSDGQVLKRLPVCIDLGGIAKGYAVDCAIASLQAQGVRAACVNAGGDLRVIGEVDFPVHVRNPAAPTEMVWKTVLRNAALATSGPYFSQQILNASSLDNRCPPDRSMLLNGQTGAAITGLRSASVCAPTCMLADALTKVVLASGDTNHPALQHFGATALYA